MKLKRIIALSLLSLGICAFGFGASSRFTVANAEPEQVEETEEVFECKVIVSEAKHGEITVDKEEGHVGDIVTIEVKSDMFYKIDAVTMNGTNLVESEETTGLFAFTLVEGENKIEAKIVIDQELLGEMSVIMDQALNKDWTHLFSAENVIRIVSFLLNGGILIAIARYFIKDKRLEKKVENKVEETISKVIPEATKQTVLATIEEFITPIFSELKLDNEEMRNAFTVFSRCFALAQENTPESRIAITQELSSLKFSDQETISRVRDEIQKFIAEQIAHNAEILKKMEEIEQSNKQIIEQMEEPEVSVNLDNINIEETDTEKNDTDDTDDGTQI